MNFEFELFDLISLITILVGLIATYWKLNTRLVVTELKVNKLEKDMGVNETKLENGIGKLDKKLEIKTQLIDDKLQGILIHLAEHRDKSGQ